ncbi:MAG: N-acetylmuramoyl-L-alanine amidase [Pseudomonadota bacterium]
MARAVLILILALVGAQNALAQDFRALARLDPSATVIAERGGGLEIMLGLSQPVPFRVRMGDVPPQLIVDFREVDWALLPPELSEPAGVAGIRAGPAVDDPGWSRLVVDLTRSMVVETAYMEIAPDTGRAQVLIRLAPTGPAEPVLAHPDPVVASEPDGGRVTIVLDPGHGGVDPGALAGDQSEADLMLTFARELREVLVRTGRIDVVMTRDADVFVSLPERVSIARQAGADALISLHADALASGRATGATVYTLSPEARAAASQAAATGFARTDLVSGADLSGADDAVVGVLLDLARQETAPRADRLADLIVAEIGAADAGLHRNPRLGAGFAVLTAAEIPSVLVEVGFLSEPSDLERITDPAWRARMQAALRDAILAWMDAPG